jgi:hypothetical protein
MAAFLGLLVAEMLGTATFLAIYLRTSDWHRSAVGRHLAVYSGALLGLYVTSILSFFVHALWLVLVVLGMHLTFAAAIWQRVVLVWRAQRG